VLSHKVFHLSFQLGTLPRSVRLSQLSTGWQAFTTVKHPDVVQAKKATFKNVQSVSILPVHPPSALSKQLTKHPNRLDQRKVKKNARLQVKQ
jgi:hypothetical protein